MPPSAEASADPLITLPPEPGLATSIRAKALLFRDPQSTALLRHVERIARSDASALVIGETGTGKELIARHLHALSGRSGPFVAVNCGAFSESLIDAELFGHESGAFTGAAQARAGWFEAAHGGTLFLDEIGNLPLALQVKLLRVLQERQVVRLGSRKPVALDVRLVAATNIDLQQAVAAQRFRAGLYYRLNVASIALPPLRERPGDIVPLARHFLGVYGPRLGLAAATLSAAAEQALLAYAWPGNIRELENVIHFALIQTLDGCVQPAQLRLVAGFDVTARAVAPTWDGLDPGPAAVPDPVETARQQLSMALQALLDHKAPELHRLVESTLVQAAFAQASDNQVRAARLLGLTRNTLRTLLKRHGLLACEAPADRHPHDGAGAALPH